jgi:hypothetical protein
MTSEESLATSSLNLQRRCIAFGLADPLLNPNVNPRKVMDIKCTF